MRKVIGIGETILDVIFRDGQPSHAVPGGSVFNGLVSLSRTGVPVCFISELGQDRVGGLILEFMRRNGMDTRYMEVYPGAKSPVSLAFLNEDNDADYTFYKDFPVRRPDADYPEIAEDDIVVIGSFYALDPATRGKVTGLLELARERKAIVYYDPNFRAPHKEEALRLAPTIIENLEYADIVRGSREDFHYMYGLDDADKVIYGRQEPGFMMGFNNTLRWKNFDFNIYFYGEFNKLMNSNYKKYWVSYNIGDLRRGYNLPASAMDVWSTENPNGTLPGFLQSYSIYGPGDYYLEKIWFIRCRNITLGYNIPVKTNKHILSNLRVYVDVDHLPKVLGGMGVAIISTSKGVMTDKQARAAHTGGEVLAYVW